MNQEEKDQRKGLGRAIQFSKRQTAGAQEFHDGFLAGKLPAAKPCALCDAGVMVVQLKRQRIHYVNRKTIRCEQ